MAHAVEAKPWCRHWGAPDTMAGMPPSDCTTPCTSAKLRRAPSSCSLLNPPAQPAAHRTRARGDARVCGLLAGFDTHGCGHQAPAHLRCCLLHLLTAQCGTRLSTRCTSGPGSGVSEGGGEDARLRLQGGPHAMSACQPSAQQHSLAAAQPTRRQKALPSPKQAPKARTGRP